MKSSHQGLGLALLLAAAALPAHAATYICQIDGRAVFTTEKTGKNCQRSSMNGISDDTPAAPENSASAPAPGSDNIAKIWEKEQFGQYDDIKILPSRPGGVTNTAEAATPPVNVKLRNQPKAKRSQTAPRTPAPVIAPPPPKPQMTRKQILQNEVHNEQTALVRAKAQLNVARKKGDKAKVSRLEQTVRDREANIRAIQSEMRR